MKIDTEHPTQHRMHVNVEKRGRVSITQYRGLDDKKAIRLRMTMDDARRLADGIHDHLDRFETR